MPDSTPTGSEAASRRRRKVAYVALVGVLAAGVAIGLMLKNEPTDTRFVIAAGVLGSLIASFIMLGANLLIPGETDGVADRLADRVGRELDALAAAVPLIANAEAHGIQVVKPKGRYERPEWETLLSDAQDRLLIIGHALNKWCTVDLEPLFVETMTRLARDGGSVRLLMLSEKGLKERRGNEAAWRRDKTLNVLAGAWARLEPTERENLEVRELSQRVAMPYMVVENGRLLVTAPYPAVGQSVPMMTLTADTTSDFGVALREDATQLFERHGARVDLDAFAVGRGGTAKQPRT